MKNIRSLSGCALVALTASILFTAPTCNATSGTWTGAANAMWVNNANWTGATYAGINTSESATFNSAGNNNTNLNIAGLFSLLNITFDTTNVAAYTIGTDSPAGQRIVIGGNGNYKLTSSAANSQIFKAAVMLGGGATAASYTFQNDNTSQLLTFNDIIVTNTGTPPGTKTLTVTGAGVTAILGHITKGTAVGITLTKTSTGTLTLAGTNVVATLNVNGGTLALTGPYGAMVISGAVAVASGATLRLDNSASGNNANRLFDTSPVSLTGGTLDFAHTDTAISYSETVGTVTLNGSGNVISTSQADSDQTSTLTLSGLVRNTGATVNFSGTGLGESARNRVFIAGQADGPMGTWVTLNGASPVVYDSVSGVQLQATTDIAAYGSTIVSNDTSNVRINSQGSGGPIALSDPLTIISSLTQNTAYDATVDTAGKALQFASAVINPSMANLTLGVSPSDGTVSSPAVGGTLSLVNDSGNALTVNAVLADNAAPSSLVKSGTGTVVLAGANTFSSNLTVSAGSLVLANSLALQNIMLGSLSGIVFDGSVASHAFTLGNLTNSFAVSLADNAANPLTLSVGNNNASSSFGGAVSGAGSLVKVGSGTLTLTGTSTYSGGTTISGGTLATGVAGGLGTGPVTNNATLNLTAGPVTYTALTNNLYGSGTINVKIGSGTTDYSPFDGDYSGFTGVWNLGVGAAASAGRARMDGVDNAAATINVLTNVALFASQPVTHNAAVFLYGGNIGHSYGQLRLDNSAVWAGPVTLVGDITDAADGYFGGYTGAGTISGLISDLGGAHPVKKINSTTLNLTCPTNTYAGQTWISAGILGATSLRNVNEASSLGKPTNPADGAIKIGSGSTSATLAYLGTGDTSDRVIDLAGTTGGATLDQSGSGTLAFTSGLTTSGAGGKTLTLQGSTDGVGELAGILSDGSPYTNKLLKVGTGTWILSGANTYSGETEVQDGTLVMSHPNAISGASLLRFTGTSTRNATLELAHDGSSETPFNAIIGYGYNGTLASGVGVGSSVGLNHVLGDLSMSRTTLTVCRASSVLSGSPAITFGTLNLNGNNTYTTVLNPTDADLHLGSAAILSGTYTKTLRLEGASSGNTITGAVYNGLAALTLYKAGASTWTLQGSNTYSGATTVNEGTLTLSGADGALVSSSSFTVNSGGTLRLANTAAANHPNRLADTKALTLNGGTLDFSHTAGAANYSEALSAVTLAAGSSNTLATSRADSSQTSTLTLSSLTRSANATLNFTGAGLGTDDRNRIFIGGQTSGLLGFWATYNDTGLAAYDAVRGVCAGTASSTEIAAKGPDSVIPDDATADVRITTAGDAGPITLAGATENRVALLQQCTDTPAEVATAAKTLRAYGLLINTNQQSLTIGQNAGDGTLTTLAAGGRLDLMNDDPVATLTINAEVADNTSPSSLAKSGPGDVVLNGTVSYSGPTAINAGSLTLGGHAIPQAFSSVISGAGSLVKSGTNLLQLLASNTYTGPTTLNAGILRINQNAALGTSAAGTFIAGGATLDVGCTPDVGGTRTANALNMQSEPITVQGAGVAGLGAIVNSSTGSQYNALGKITLSGDTVFGGRSRWDVRDSWMVMNDHALTKIGPDVVSLSSSVITPGEAGTASIDVQEGQFRLQRTTTLGGSAANTITLRSGSQFELYEVTSEQAWSFALNNGSAISIIDSTANRLNNWLTGPLTLNGEVFLTGNSSVYGTLSGDITGNGTLVKTNGVNFYITGTNNTYTGATLIRGGALYITSLRNVGEACSLGQPATEADGTIPIGIGSTSGRLTYLGAGDTSDRVIDMAGTTGSMYLEQAGEGLLTLRNFTVSGSGTKTLYLQGSTSGVAEISAAIPNGPSGTVVLNKSGTGAWTLSGNNTYSGSTTMSGGVLNFTGNNTCSGATTVDSGALTYSGTNILGALTLNAGTVSILGTNSGYGGASIVAGAAGKNGTLILSPGSSLSSSNSFRIGNTSGYGALYLDGGSFLNTAGDSDQNFAFARENNSYGYLKMTRGGSVSAKRLQMSGLSNTSNIGRSLARIVDGVLTFSDYILLGRNPGCETVLTMDGGTFNHANSTKNFGLAWAGGRAELNLTGGTVDNTARSVTTLEGGGTYGTGIVNLCSGTLIMASATNFANSVFILNFAGGTLIPSANHTAFLPSRLSGVNSYGAFGAYAGGAVVDTAGKNVTVAAPLQAPAGQGVYAIELAEQGSGYIGEPYVSIEGDGVGATAVANMTDDGTGNGTYKVASVTITCPGVSYAAAPTVLFKGGGATNTLTTALAGTVTLTDNASGGLTKQGEGILTLGAANTYTGTTTVAGGTLKLGVANALLPNTQVTLASGTLDLSGYTVTNAVSGSGLVTNGTLQAVLSPAGEDAVGADTIALNSATLKGLYLADVTAAGESDSLAVQGNINLSDIALQIVNPDLLDTRRCYTLLTCTGTRTGSFSSTNLPDGRWRVLYLTDGTVKLFYAGGTLLRVF